jgi:hypothetical protein
MRKFLAMLFVVVALSMITLVCFADDSTTAKIDVFAAGGALAVAIPFIVNFIKNKLGGSKFAPAVAFVLGIIGGLLAKVTGFVPDGMTMFQAILAGIAVGGTSTGLYDFTKKLTGN